MKKRVSSKETAQTVPRSAKSASAKKRPPWAVALVMVVLAAVVLVGVEIRSTRRKASPASDDATRPSGALTFNKDVAPVVFERCAYCHRPGQSAPFSLLTYADVKKRSKQIAEVTASRLMPPWLPDPGYGDFSEARSLSADQLGVLQRWIAEGAVEGDPANPPSPPQWSGGWRLGNPDLVVTLPQPYSLAAEGKDVYRNVVIPISLPGHRFVKGVEFLPGNARVMHHAFINVDETRQSRRLAEKQTPPGFDGMELPESAVMPGGQLLGWQPGKAPHFASDGLSWLLKTNMDLVVQMHLHPSGKPETVQPSIGLYFTDQAPTNVPFRIKLARFDFEIPAGEARHVVEESYTLPVEVSLIGVLPHAHYLGKDLQAYALLPGGEKRWLLWIKDWDFNWQGDYKYAQPVGLPAGARLVMRYTYDNSANNPRNPSRPPKLVRHGLETTDEMAGLVFQAVARNATERSTLAKDYGGYFVRVSMDYYRFLLRLNDQDAAAHLKLGRALASMGSIAEGLPHLLSAVRLNPTDDKGHYELGYVYLLQNRMSEAEEEFQTVIRLNPDDGQAHGNLGYIRLRTGRMAEARASLETAVRLNPDDRIAQQNLARLKGAKQEK
ncbi:MAG: tetratricopeptide repeat protein [Verrucomicrobia bacterium]|nr:tetratricopeptide repeat protein [Verrucomicrobiota bacterium]